jgi:hypothetical protein
VAGPGAAIQTREVGADFGSEGNEPSTIQVEITDEFKEIRLLLHHDGRVPVLEEVAHPRVTAVKAPT